MFRIAALNLSDDEEDDTLGSYKGRTKEVQEEEAFSLYEKALDILRLGDLEEAEKAFSNILDTSLVQEAPEPSSTNVGRPLVHPGLQLKYSTHKNLASIATQCGHHETAMGQYIEAVKLDNSDVTVWYKAGVVAKRIHNYQLAKFCFSQGLLCNKNHWPCLNAIVLVLFAISDYSDCLYYIGQALTMDNGYIRGLVLRRQIYKEMPFFKRSTENYFKVVEAEPEVELTEEEVEGVLQEAEEMREHRRKLSKTEPPPPLAFKRPMKCYGWLELAESLIVQYDYCHVRRPPETLSARLDFDSMFETIRPAPMEVVEAVEANAVAVESTASATMTVTSSVSDATLLAQSSTSYLTASATSGVSEATSRVTLTSSATSVEPSCTDVSTTDVVMTSLEKDSALDASTNLSPSQELTSQVTSASVEVSATSLTVTSSIASIEPDKLSTVTSEPSSSPRTPLMPCSQASVTSASNVVTSTSEPSVETPSAEMPLPIDVETPVAMETPAAVTANKGVTRVLFMKTSDHQYAISTMAEPSASESTIDTATEDSITIEEVTKKRGQKRRKSSTLFDEELYCGKRRSLRVRNTADRHQKKKKKEEVTVNYSELLLKFLPHSLFVQLRKPDRHLSETDTDGPNEKSSQSEKTANERKEETADPDKSLLTNEAKEVEAFIKEQTAWCSTLGLLTNFLHALKDRAHLVWPERLCELYVKLYKRARRHFDYPCYYDCNDETKDLVRDDIKLILVWAELQVDEWNLVKQKTPSNSPTSNRLSPSLCQNALSDFPGEYFPGELHYLCGLMAFPDIVQDFWAEYRTRVLWLKSKFMAIKNEMEGAVNIMNHLRRFLEFVQTEHDLPVSVEYTVVNTRVEPVINAVTVKAQLESLERCQSLEELQKLYNEADYEQVIAMLLPTFSLPTNRGKLLVKRPAIPERHAQLLLLEDALLNSKNGLRCLTWSEECVQEALRWYVTSTGPPERTDWSNTLMCLLDGLNKCLTDHPGVIAEMEGRPRIRLVRNLIRIIELGMDQNHLDMTISTLVPWILLYHFIVHEEKVQRLAKSPDEPSEWAVSIPNSLSLLDVAHDLLGRHSWCTRSSGALLMFYSRQLCRVLDDESLSEEVEEHRSDLEESLEQCFYCLYGYPTKKRSRNLGDHNAPQIELTWDRAKDLFDYFKPKSIPEFDSYVADSIPGELEGLLRRIIALSTTEAPRELSGKLLNYIEGADDQAPEEEIENIPVLSEIYYLLADYHFKSKEFAKAIKYYMQDLALNPARFDSWAGMALSRSSKLEQRLSSMENRFEGTIHKHASCTLRCYRRALDLDDTNAKLWIEYGSFSYQLHSYSSRQAKMTMIFPLADHSLTLAKSTKQEMLKLAAECFTEAGDCGTNEEAWLQQYILGKVAEKTKKPPSVYLTHYQTSARCLHDDGARYPKKIQYTQTPAYMAVESLEVFYRIHVSVVKCLLRPESRATLDHATLDVFEKFLVDAIDSPFAKGQEKKSDNKDGTAKEVNEDSIPPTTELRKPPLVERALSQDSVLSILSTDESLLSVLDSQKGVTENLTEISSRKNVLQMAESLEGSSIGSPVPIDIESESLNSSASSLESTMCGEDYDDSSISVVSDVLRALLERITDTAESTREGFTEVAHVKTETRNTSNSIAETITTSRSIPETTNTSNSIHESTNSSSSSSLPETGVKRKLSVSDEKLDSKKLNTELDQSKNVKIEVEKTPVKNKDSVEACTSLVIDEILDQVLRTLETVKTENDSEMKDFESWLKELIWTTLESRLDTSNKKDSVDSDEPSFHDCIAETLNSLTELANLSGSFAVTAPLPRSRNDSDDSEGFQTLEDVEKVEKETEEKGVPEEKNLEKTVNEENNLENTASKDKNTENTANEGTNLETAANKDEENAEEELEKAEEVVEENVVKGKNLNQSGLSQELDDRAENLLNLCIRAFHLCLARLQTHYKSIYQLAVIYFKSPWHKDLSKCRDVLAGTSDWQQLDHMPCPGLFQDRKPSNFFNNVWRIPIEDIDRCGSFATHMYRCVSLLLEVLLVRHDFATLHSCYLQLQRNPDGAKKYMRDQERVAIAKRALKYALQSLDYSVSDNNLTELKGGNQKGKSTAEKALETISTSTNVEQEFETKTKTAESKMEEESLKLVDGTQKKADKPVDDVMRKFLVSVYKMWTCMGRSSPEFKRVNAAFVKTFKVYKPEETCGLTDVQVSELASKTLSQSRRRETETASASMQERPANTTAPVVVSATTTAPSTTTLTSILKPTALGKLAESQQTKPAEARGLVSMVTKDALLAKLATKVVKPSFVRLMDAARGTTDIVMTTIGSPTGKGVVTATTIARAGGAAPGQVPDVVSLSSSDDDIALGDDVSSESDKDSDYNPTDDEVLDDDDGFGRKKKRAKLSPSAMAKLFSPQFPAGLNPSLVGPVRMQLQRPVGVQQRPGGPIAGQQRPIGPTSGLQRPPGQQRPLGLLASQQRMVRPLNQVLAARALSQQVPGLQQFPRGPGKPRLPSQGVRPVGAVRMASSAAGVRPAGLAVSRASTGQVRPVVRMSNPPGPAFFLRTMPDGTVVRRPAARSAVLGTPSPRSSVLRTPGPYPVRLSSARTPSPGGAPRPGTPSPIPGSLRPAVYRQRGPSIQLQRPPGPRSTKSPQMMVRQSSPSLLTPGGPQPRAMLGARMRQAVFTQRASDIVQRRVRPSPPPAHAASPAFYPVTPAYRPQRPAHQKEAEEDIFAPLFQSNAVINIDDSD